MHCNRSGGALSPLALCLVWPRDLLGTQSGQHSRFLLALHSAGTVPFALCSVSVISQHGSSLFCGYAIRLVRLNLFGFKFWVFFKAEVN